MTLFDLKNKIDFSFDIADDEVVASFYAELDEIPDAVARNIEVVQISRDLVTCKLTDYLRRFANFHPSKMREFLTSTLYEGETLDHLVGQLCEKWKRANRTNGEDITDDGGEAVAYFVEFLFYDFITDFLAE